MDKANANGADTWTGNTTNHFICTIVFPFSSRELTARAYQVVFSRVAQWVIPTRLELVVR